MVLSGTAATSAAVSTSTGLPATTDGIHMAQTFDVNISNTGVLAGKVDYIWGATKPVSGIHSDWYSAMNIEPLRTCSGTVNCPVQDRLPGSRYFSWWKQNHPDWIVYRCDQTTPAADPSPRPTIVLDISNPAVRAYQLGLATSALKSGFDGVAWDNVLFTNFTGSCGTFRKGVWTSLGYPSTNTTNAKLTDDVASWLQYMRSHLQQQFPTKTMEANFPFIASPSNTAGIVVRNTDMVYQESAFTAPPSETRWLREVQFLEQLNEAGKAFVDDNIFPTPSMGDLSHAQVNWALANYLLVKGNHSYLSVRTITNGQRSSGYFFDRPEYHVAIGLPVSGRFDSNGIQFRKYSGGLAAVNPSSTNTVPFKVGTGYTDLYGNQVTGTVTLQPASAIVLLKS